MILPVPQPAVQSVDTWPKAAWTPFLRVSICVLTLVISPSTSSTTIKYQIFINISSIGTNEFLFWYGDSISFLILMVWNGMEWLYTYYARMMNIWYNYQVKYLWARSIKRIPIPWKSCIKVRVKLVALRNNHIVKHWYS